MRSRTYSAQTFIGTSTAGASNRISYWILPVGDTSLNNAGEMLHFSSPLALINTTFVEGTDYPFFTRGETAWADTPWAARNRRKAFVLHALRAADFLGMPIPVIALPPDETPIVVGKLTEGPQRNWNLRRKANLLSALRATSDAPGYWAEFIPAAAYSSSSCDFLSDLQRIMMEPVIDEGVTWSLWSQAEVLGYLNQRIIRFVMETGLLRTRQTIAGISGSSDYDLDPGVMDIRRTVWNSGSSRTVLNRTDTFAFDQGTPGWEASSGTPIAFSEYPRTPLSIQILPTPSANGTIELIVVLRPADVIGNCEVLVLPNFFTPYLKYGVLSDMLSKQGEANDPQRADYCEQRFSEGISLGKLLLGTGD